MAVNYFITFFMISYNIFFFFFCSDLDDILLASIDHSGFFCYKYPESDPQMDTKTDLDSTQRNHFLSSILLLDNLDQIELFLTLQNPL